MTKRCYLVLIVFTRTAKPSRGVFCQLTVAHSKEAAISLTFERAKEKMSADIMMIKAEANEHDLAFLESICQELRDG